MKLNKEKKEALESLVYDLDELSNKPRRLFSSLYKFVDAFIDDKDKEHKGDILADIMEWQDMFYNNVNNYSILEECGRASRETRKELTKKILFDDLEDDYYRGYENGVKEATKKMALIMTKELIEELY